MSGSTLIAALNALMLKRLRPPPWSHRLWYWAADALAELGAMVHLAHPLGVQAFSYRRVKNDQRDAADLADLLRMARLPHAWIAPAETRELRELVRHRAKLVAMRSQCKAHVHAVLAKGGIWLPMTDLFGVEGNLLLDKVTMPAPYKERIASLRRLIEVDAEIDLFTGLVQRRLTHDAGYTAIQKIPGIGPVLAAVFVAEIGDVRRFAGPAQLTCWAGLTPSHHESDTTVHRGRITKQGSRLVRWAAIESVKILPKSSLIGGIREKVAQRRGNRNIGAVAAARRQLELVFYGLRDHHVRALHRSPRVA
ncbi:IS110 family transposase [Mycobacterium nebraskense]|uniref:IS110 family transposase n=1 Tax=Mycobacterium nebraskense TaxID=244292 RepID=UPI0006986BE5|nr:IS110 family transposase [Mycobacterium nebraskense]